MTSLAYDLRRGYRGLDCIHRKDLQIDPAKASATGVFAAASQDRCGDVIEIKGIDVANHQKNPIVLWLHSLDWSEPDCAKPIGITEDADGKHTVKLLPDQGIAEATTFFTQKTLLASQICALVMEKMIRGQSIGYRERKVERMIEDDRYVGTKLLEIEMLETSWVPLPMNQDAVRSALSRDWAGKSLHPSIHKALSPFASPTPIWANGWTPQNAPAPAAGTALGTGLPTPPLAATGEKTMSIKMGAPSDAAATEPEEAVQKHGEKALRTCHKAMSRCKGTFLKALEPLDDDSSVRDVLAGHADKMDSCLGELSDHFGEKYADSDPLEEEDLDQQDAGETTKDDDEVETEEEKALAKKLHSIEIQLNHKLRLKKQPA